MCTTISFANISCSKPHKLKCGDTSYAGKITIGNKEYYIIIVCDGVTTCSNDWLASGTLAGMLLSYLKETNESVIHDAVRKAILCANSDLISGVKGITRLWSTLALLLFEIETGKVLFFTAGDTRIYGIRSGRIIQLSTDDLTYKPCIENGKIKYKSGQPIMYRYVTRSVGYSKELDVIIQVADGIGFSAFFVASDGMYNLPSFEDNVSIILRKENMQDMLANNRKIISEKAEDDASVAILRMRHSETIAIRTVKDLIEKDIELFEFERKSMVQKLMLKAIELHEEEEINLLLQYISRNALFNRTELIQILELMIKQRISSDLNEKAKQLIWRNVLLNDNDLYF